MLKRFAAGLCAFITLAGPVLAQSCDMTKLGGAIDRYAAEPFSARTWRVLNGLGDPMQDQSTPGDDYWGLQNRWKAITRDLAPEAEGLQDLGYNCRIAYPLSILDKRLGSLGRNHPYVKEWLGAQEKVMEACADDGDDTITLPPPREIEPAFLNLQKMDRAYQEASIAFYRNRERALPLFRAIGQSNSPHRAAARYNVANLLANAKRPAEARKEAEAILSDSSLASVHAITRELLGYIAHQEDTAEGWTGIIERNVAILEKPAPQILATSEARREYAAALYDIDFAGVRAKDGDWWLKGELPEGATVSKALVDTSRKYPMVLWMMAGQSANDDYRAAPWSMIGSKWQDHMSRYIDAALRIEPSASGLKGPALEMLKALAARPDDATRAALWSSARTAIDAATKSCGSDPQTASAGFLLSHAVRLSAMAGKHDEAYQVLDTLPFKSARSYYHDAVFALAQHAVGQGDAALARAIRDRYITPALLAAIPENQRSETVDGFSELLALIAEDDMHWKDALKLHSDPASNILFNFLPSKTLWAYAADSQFGEPERALFARAAWTRDYALGRKIAPERTELLHSLNPAMRTIATKVEADYPKAGPERRRLLTILRSPRHNILVAGPSDWRPASLRQDNFTDVDAYDHNDKNWWCPLEPDRQLGALRSLVDGTTGTANLSGYWLKQLADVYDADLRVKVDQNRDQILKANPVVKSIIWKEVSALASTASAPKRLTQAAVRWGKASKGDDGAPEALALAVKATRYGCNWHGGHGVYSKAAQQLLQAKFKDTSWAKQTPFWFNCQRQEYDKDYNKVTTCEPKAWAKQAPLK
jgi:hypothetical protein